MAVCPSLGGCIFFNDQMEDKPDIISEVFKIRYCKGCNALCARWKVASTLGKTYVPKDLFPNQMDRANELLTLVAK